MSDTTPERIHPFAALAALAFPGAGHLMLGQPVRAAAAAVGVLGLFFGGMFVGGIDVVDSREDQIWFYGEALVGPVALGVDYAHQHWFKAYGRDLRADPSAAGHQIILRSGYPDEHRVYDQAAKKWTWQPAPAGQGPPNVKSLAKVNEIGTLYCTLAGMMNLIIVLDALMPTRGRRVVVEPAGGDA